ncbi:MAG: hypothetical protein EOP09_08345 [Proteobacteria bacterium]|nr:MAG: hypothetical protein EOP09_08345 [Pseudomonadota bacterium]
MTNELQIFLISVSRQTFVDAARVHIGVRCESVGLCVGFILLTLRDVGLLPPDTDIKQSHLSEVNKLPRLWHFLLKNANEVPFKGEVAKDELPDLRPGDLLLSRWLDENAEQNEIHHINIWTGWNDSPFGQQMQCLLPEHGGTGTVQEVPLNSLDWRRIERVYRLHVLVGGEA